MLDTNLIIVENIKALVSKVKIWVENLYPITYTESGSSSNLSFYTSKSLANKSLELNTAGGNTDISSDIYQLTVNDEASSAIGCTNSCTIGDTSYVKLKADGTCDVHAKTTIEVKDNTGNQTIKLGGSTVFAKALNKIKLAFSSGAKAELGNGSLSLQTANNGRIILGKTPADIDYDIPYGLYLGHNKPVGYEYTKANTGGVNSGTSWTGWDTGTGSVYEAHPSEGTWLASYTILCSSATDGMRLAGKWFLNGEELNQSTCIQTSCGTGQIAIQGNAIFRLPYTQKSGNVLLLKCYQNSGANKDLSVYTHITRLA